MGNDSPNDDLNRWGGITAYTLDEGTVAQCYAYRLFGDEWTRTTLEPDERSEYGSVSEVPESHELVGLAENHPTIDDENENDRKVVAVFAPFGGHEWATVKLTRAESTEAGDE